MKFCVRVGLLSGQVFCPFGEDWLAGSHGGGGINSGINYHPDINGKAECVNAQCGSVGQLQLGWRRCLRPYGGISVLQTDLFFVSFLYGYGFLSGGKRSGRESLRACSTTIRTGLLLFC